MGSHFDLATFTYSICKVNLAQSIFYEGCLKSQIHLLGSESKFDLELLGPRRRRRSKKYGKFTFYRLSYFKL